MSKSDLESAISGGADAVGFIVEIIGSRHRITAEAARDLIMKVPLFVKSVAVIAPRSLDEAVILPIRQVLIFYRYMAFMPERSRGFEDNGSAEDNCGCACPIR